MLKIFQAGFQQYMNWELPDVQAGFRRGRGTRNQIANMYWIIEKARKFQKNIYFCFIDYTKAFDCVDQNKLENSSRDGNTRPPYLPPEKSVCRSRSIETCIISYMKQITSPGSMHDTGCSWLVHWEDQRDGMGREVAGGFRMGDTSTPMADSCWCMAKPIQ